MQKELLTGQPAASDISSVQRGQGQGRSRALFFWCWAPAQAHVSKHMCTTAIRSLSNTPFITLVHSRQCVCVCACACGMQGTHPCARVPWAGSSDPWTTRGRRREWNLEMKEERQVSPERRPPWLLPLELGCEFRASQQLIVQWWPAGKKLTVGLYAGQQRQSDINHCNSYERILVGDLGSKSACVGTLTTSPAGLGDSTLPP